MKNTISIALIITLFVFTSCNKNRYKEIDKEDLRTFTKISEIWKDKDGNRLLYAYTGNGAIATGRDWIYQKNSDPIKYFLIDRSNGFFSPPLEVSYYKDSLILLKEDESGGGINENLSWWLQVNVNSLTPFNNDTNFIINMNAKYNEQTKGLSEGVYKLIGLMI